MRQNLYIVQNSHETMFTTDPKMGKDVMSRGRHIPQLCGVSKCANIFTST